MFRLWWYARNWRYELKHRIRCQDWRRLPCGEAHLARVGGRPSGLQFRGRRGLQGVH